MQDLPDQLLERTRDGRLRWREDRVKPGQVARHFVASGYELLRFNDASIQLVWKDEDQYNKSLSSRDSSLVLQLWNLASGETSIPSVIAPQIAVTPTDSTYTSHVYTRDYVKTCTVRVLVDDKDEHCGLLVSNAGHIVTTSEAVPPNAG